MEQADIDQNNSEFWNTLCGSTAASSLGITDRSSASLEKFDNWFFDFYPYLGRYIPFQGMRGKNVLEVGLGYGSVGQKIAEADAQYTGLDIAEGPVEMMNYRLLLKGLPGEAIIGSILEAPFTDASFDYIVAIGCYHHTGNLPKAIDESYRLLRKGGRLIVMVYNGLSYRQWAADWKGTLRQWATARSQLISKTISARYDFAHGKTAPHTDFVSQSSLRNYCRQFHDYQSALENISDDFPLKRSREELIATVWPKLIGLDIYATAVKR